MYIGVDSRGIGLNKKRNEREYFSVFYILFVIVGSFFIINLFTGVIVEAFSTEKLFKVAGQLAEAMTVLQPIWDEA